MLKNRNIIGYIFALFFFITTPIIFNHIYAQGKTVTVTGEILHLREGPGLSYPILDTLDKGEHLTYIEQNGEWIHVKNEQQEGWVASWLTSISEETKQQYVHQTIISQVDYLNIRSEPSLSAVVLGQLTKGQQANILQRQTGWLQIDADGLTGWVSEDYVTINEKQTEKVENTNTATQTIPIKKGALYFTINVDALNVRKKADLNSKKLATIKKDQVFEIIDRQNNWLQIQLPNNKKGWVYSFYGTITAGYNNAKQYQTQNTKKSTSQYITILYNGTNLREHPSTGADVVTRVDAGASFQINRAEGDWYQIQVNNDETAYVASWVVSISDSLGHPISNNSNQNKLPTRKKGTLKGLTIVVDAGHGGNDHGTTGVRGTEEKDMTLQTASLLASKLSAAGANIIMTRESDQYIDLRKRVSVAHQHNADAFISIHYDATDDNSISGFTTYYMNSNQQQLAETVHAALSEKIELRNRGAQPGNYLVLRENRQPAILLELGYLSNPSEERTILKSQFREQATNGIYNGMIDYFDQQLAKQ